MTLRERIKRRKSDRLAATYGGTSVDNRNNIFAKLFARREEKKEERFDWRAKRRDFRIKVSGNRKWIMIGLAIVAVCGTLIYFSW